MAMMMHVLHYILYCALLATRMGRDRKQQELPIIVANELQEVLAVIENCISKISNYIHDSKELSETLSTTSKTPNTLLYRRRVSIHPQWTLILPQKRN